MKDYPYLSYFTIYTKKTPDEGAFIGEIGTSSFKVVPRPTWLQPRGIHAVLEGSIRTEADETVVDVKMRLPWGGVPDRSSLFFICNGISSVGLERALYDVFS